MAAETSAGRALLIYDGDCAFCSSCAEWVRRRLPNGYNITAWQRLPHLDALKLSADDVVSAAYWIDADGHRPRGERAVGRALVEIGGLWAVLGGAIMLPGIRAVARVPQLVVTRALGSGC